MGCRDTNFSKILSCRAVEHLIVVLKLKDATKWIVENKINVNNEYVNMVDVAYKTSDCTWKLDKVEYFKLCKLG